MKKFTLMLILFCFGIFVSCKSSDATMNTNPPASTNTASSINTNSSRPKKNLPPKSPLPPRSSNSGNSDSSASVTQPVPQGMVLVSDFAPFLVEDLRYATTNNFLGRKLYTDPKCYLTKEAAEHLAQAQNYLTGLKPGYKLKVWDCYRPMPIQEEMWRSMPNTEYVGDPKYAKHPQGLAVDATIVDSVGNEIEMPTGFDDFSSKAYTTSPASKMATANRRMLQQVMMSGTFVPVNSEWWHFEYIGPR